MHNFFSINLLRFLIPPRGYALYNLSTMFETRGELDSALEYLKAYTDVKDILNQRSNAIDAYRAYVGMALEASEAKLTIA